MQIEVVQPGGTLYAIARKYGVSVERIAETNAIADPSRLVVGQALLIPIGPRRHTVQPGESLWLIARRYGVTVESIVTLNGMITPSALQVGRILLIPDMPKRTIESNAYLEPSVPARDRMKVQEAADALTYLSVFSYRARSDGSLQAPDADAALAAVQGTPAVPMMTLTNFAGGTFSADIAKAIFDDATARGRLIDNVLAVMSDKGYAALNIDFEHVFPADRERYNAFLREIAPRLHAQGYLLSTALAPKTSAAQVGQWYEAHDYPAHGEIADFVVLMTYEWGWSGGPPLPVAPLPQVQAVLNYAVTVIPRGKIVMGAPLYGYDWTLPYVKGGPFAKSLGLNEAVEQALRVGTSIQYDYTAQAPHYTYYDAQGKEHIVWFEDVRSFRAKFDIVREYGLRGISYWALGKPYPQVWTYMKDQFVIRSRR